MPVEEPYAGISACQMQGMMLAPQWLDRHPGWSIKRIRCALKLPVGMWFPRASARIGSLALAAPVALHSDRAAGSVVSVSVPGAGQLVEQPSAARQVIARLPAPRLTIDHPEDRDLP